MASTGSGSKAGQVRTGRPARWRSPAALAAGAVIVWILVPPPVLAGRPRPAGRCRAGNAGLMTADVQRERPGPPPELRAPAGCARVGWPTGYSLLNTVVI